MVRQAATGRRIRWSPGDVSKALGLRCLTRRGYKYAQGVLKIPLPSVSTLSRWTRAFRVTPGVMDAAASVLEAITTDMSDMDRLCVISFDEMSLDSRYCYDSTADQVLRGSKLQLLMVRGLCSPWKQPLYYQLDSAMTPGELVHVIVRLESIGLSVVAATSDMHSSTVSSSSVRRLVELTAAVEEAFRAVTLQPTVPPVIGEYAGDDGAATDTGKAVPKLPEDVWLKWEGMTVIEAFEVLFCIIVDRLWSWIRALFGGCWSWFAPGCISDSDPMNQAQAAETVAAWEQPNGSVSVSGVLW
ncbi:Transposable element P transposase [Amphibalanus amphitrite]|uniref:Transposable element P transposase n=1 Tax=Amphibalanus amphitrite TaxID=1232801 RepID=A0A6A4VIY1_AMPAM|nr:Transposable element P transposase [Amphibalanus amphitrite]